MKKYIVIRLVSLVLVITILLLSIGSYAMLHNSYTNFRTEASDQIIQIEEILAENDTYATKLQEELNADFLIRAKAAAYMIQYNQDIIYDIEQLEYITDLLQIDEIHLFNHDGIIYSGNVPEYYGFSVESGDQMRFFAPLLSDYDLELAQNVTPNTAEEKEMQYVAVWSEDRQHIVQIGIEPLRLLEAMQATELSYIFSRLTHSSNTIFFAVDAASGDIIISTNQEVSDLNLSDLNLPYLEEIDIEEAHNVTILGEPGHLLLKEQANNIYIGYFENHASVYNSTLLSITLLIAFSLGVAALIILLIYFLLDRVVLRGLSELEKGMELIAGGDLDYKMNVAGLPEFEVLSSNVNFMVKRVVESSRKFSTIFDLVNIPIAMYECKSNAVITTGNLAGILQISPKKLEKYLKSPSKFLSNIEETMSHPYHDEKDIYVVSTPSKERFLKIMRYKDAESDWGIIIDSTDEITEKIIIKKERDLDFLTGLLSKRAFFEQLEILSENSSKTKKAIVIMFDLDNLKYVNDSWGHETGDKFIRAAADVLHSCEYEHKICSRLSGDELAMVLYDANDYNKLEIELGKIKELFSKSYITTPTDIKHKVSASIGYSLYPEHSDSFNTCLNFADKAMYSAKSKLKGSAEKYESSIIYDIPKKELE